MIKRFLFITLIAFSLESTQEPYYFIDGADSSGRYKLHTDFVSRLEEQYKEIQLDSYFNSKNKVDHLYKNAKKIVLDEEDPINTQAFFIDRKKEKLVIVIPPLRGKQERMAHVAAIFPDADILFLSCYYVDRSLGLDFFLHWQAGTLNEGFAHASNYAIRAYEWAIKQKYKEIGALGVCFGACLVVEAQLQLQKRESSFDRIILDSMPESLHALSKNHFQDPTGVISGGAGTSSDIWKSIASFTLLKGLYNFASDTILPELSFVDRIKNVTAPVMFVHGSSDASVTNEQFNRLYAAVSHSKKCALITSFCHMRHCRKGPGVYAEFTNRFMKIPKEDLGEVVGILLAIRNEHE